MPGLYLRALISNSSIYSILVAFFNRSCCTYTQHFTARLPAGSWGWMLDGEAAGRSTGEVAERLSAKIISKYFNSAAVAARQYLNLNNLNERNNVLWKTNFLVTAVAEPAHKERYKCTITNSEKAYCPPPLKKKSHCVCWSRRNESKQTMIRQRSVCNADQIPSVCVSLFTCACYAVPKFNKSVYLPTIKPAPFFLAKESKAL